jgi:hypothetical protein
MMLVTCAWLPPICAAMLPQKFSAATTWTTAPETGVLDVVGVFWQATKPTRMTIMSNVSKKRFAILDSSYLVAISALIIFHSSIKMIMHYHYQVKGD